MKAIHRFLSEFGEPPVLNGSVPKKWNSWEYEKLIDKGESKPLGCPFITIRKDSHCV